MFKIEFQCQMIMSEVENMMKEQIRSKLESQGINLDQVNLIDLDFEKLNIDLDDDEQESRLKLFSFII